MQRRIFGQTPDGDAEEVVLAAGDLTVSILNWGAVIRDVRLAGVPHPLVLGFERMEDYILRSPFFGAVVGRCANRIAGGHFDLDGEAFDVTLNEAGRTHLHGGTRGYGVRLWRIEEQDDASVTLVMDSHDGDEGYPGNVRASCRYAIEAPGTLVMEATAVTDRPTLVNLAQHSYFNLDGSSSVLDHHVRIHADGYVPTDSHKIPTGEILPVSGTVFDFRAPRPIRPQEHGAQVAYDHNFAVGMERSETLRPAVRMTAGGIALDIETTLPGIQFYIAGKLGRLEGGLDGRTYGPYAGCCFEPQYFPDAVNQPAFASPVLRPGQTYRETSRFVFGRA